jgi:hypothetical protein
VRRPTPPSGVAEIPEVRGVRLLQGPGWRLFMAMPVRGGRRQQNLLRSHFARTLGSQLIAHQRSWRSTI